MIQFAPSLFKGIRKQYSRLFEPRAMVAVLPIRGVLYNSTYYVKNLKKFFKNKDIKAILLKIECPGSASGTGETIFREIQALKEEYNKPVVALVENVCASGGLWIACSADHIIAPGTALVGSIGVALPHLFQLKNFIEQYKVGYKNMKAGTYKTIGDPFVDITPEEQQLLQDVLNDTYRQFTQEVAKARKLSLANQQEWADGKIFTAAQALKLGLIDEIGSPHQAVAALKEKAMIEGKIEWVYPPSNASLLQSMIGTDQNDEGSVYNSLIDAIGSYIEGRSSVLRT